MEIKLSEPSVEQWQEKEYGSTTLKQCGWCKFASGTHRHNYCIEGKCSLDKSYAKKVVWSDTCRFIDASQSEIEAIEENHKYRINEAKNSIVRHEGFIKVLEGLKKKAPNCPPLPDDRKYDHFNLGEGIVIYVGGEWVSGVVENGYRHHESCVSYKLEDVGPQEGGFWGCGVAVPTILLKSEYEFFKENPSIYKTWCKKAYNKSFNGTKIEVAAL